jgi:hypothetical protein
LEKSIPYSHFGKIMKERKKERKARKNHRFEKVNLDATSDFSR